MRAKTSVTAAKVQPDERQRRNLEVASRQYLALAETFLRPPPARLIAIGGFSGFGKSTLARRLGPGIGPAPGALILRSDVIRKSLLGIPPLTRLGAEGYTPEMTRRVYDTIAARALTALKAGHPVIADAVYASPQDRAAIAAVARDAGAPFAGVWLDGPLESWPGDWARASTTRRTQPMTCSRCNFSLDQARSIGTVWMACQTPRRSSDGPSRSWARSRRE